MTPGEFRGAGSPAPGPKGSGDRTPGPSGFPRPVLVRLAELLLVTAGAALVVLRFVAIDAASHSASDTLRPWVLEAGAIAAAVALVVLAAERTISPRGRR